MDKDTCGELDRAAIDAVLAGDEEAFSGIVERHGDAIQRQMRGFTRDPVILEDLSHEVFVEAYLSLARFRGDAPFAHWLARIATHIGYKFWKIRDKEKKHAPLHEIAEPAAPEQDDAPVQGSPDAAAELLFALLEHLPTDDRMVLTLMYLEKLTQEEIARRLGWTRVAVAVRIHRAKAKLRKLGEKEPWKSRLSEIVT